MTVDVSVLTVLNLPEILQQNPLYVTHQIPPNTLHSSKSPLSERGETTRLNDVIIYEPDTIFHSDFVPIYKSWPVL